MLLNLLALTSFYAAASAQQNLFTNPVRYEASDPHVVTHEGMYYLTHTEGGFISVTRSNTISMLQPASQERTVWEDSTPGRSTNIWAPEMHFINGIWHILYTAGNGDIGAGQRSFILRGCDTNPYDCEYTFAAELTPAPGGQGRSDGNWPWSIDGTWLNLEYAGGHGSYHVVSAIGPDGTQNIAICTFDTKTYAVGPWHFISAPTEPWEKAMAVAGQPTAVNEGPNPLYHGNRTWLSYSASWCGTPNYALGLLAYDGVGNPLDATSWSKQGPVFTSTTGDFVGTGHNAFFSSPDNTETWNAYHATSNSAGSCGIGRYTNAQKVNFDANGNPDLGTPSKYGKYPYPSGDKSAPMP